MKCEVCGRDYVALGVHVKHKHGITAREYKVQFGMLMTQPLVDSDLSEHLSRAAIRRMTDPEEHAICAELCRMNAATMKGKKLDCEFGPAARARIASSNSSRNDAYLRTMAPKVSKLIDAGGAINDVKGCFGMGGAAVRRMIEMGLVSCQPEHSKAVQAKRFKATQAKKDAALALRIQPHVKAAMHRDDLLKRSGINQKTYYRLVRASLIPRMPDGRSVA